MPGATTALPGALIHLGYSHKRPDRRNILKRHGIPPAPERQKTTTWTEFIRTHMDVLVATDFFTAEVWTTAWLVTYYVLFFIHLASRKVHVAGMTPHPDERWMVQIARNVTMEEWGFLTPGQYLIHDRDGKFCPAFQHTIDAAGVKRVPLPPRSPDLNAYAERWVRSIKEEVSVAADPLWRALPAARAPRIRHAFSSRASASRQGQCGTDAPAMLQAADRGSRPSPVSRTSGRLTEVLRPRSSMRAWAAEGISGRHGVGTVVARERGPSEAVGCHEEGGWIWS